MSSSRRLPLVVLCFLPFVSVAIYGLFFCGSVVSPVSSLFEAAVCEGLNEDLAPVGAGNSFHYGVRQIGLWFRYRSARKGDTVQVEWFYGSHLVFRESFVLQPMEGIRAFYLVREDGTPLPPGEYCVRVGPAGLPHSRLDFLVCRTGSVP
jgi:hypothetical protein